jgi:molybdopterin-guanine dinucleotide biosynthesis protein A
MLERVLDAVAPAVDEVVVNCRPGQHERVHGLLDGRTGARTAVDTAPDSGPLVGLATGLAATDADRVLGVPCDRPALVTPLVEFLFETARDAVGAVPHVDGYPQPLCAVYDRTEAIQACERALARGDRRLCVLPETLPVVAVPASTLCSHGWLDALDDVDTRPELP